MPDSSVSIIIPYRTADRWVEEAVASCLAQSLPPLEIILLPDGADDRPFAGCRMIPTGPIFPATKRNMGIAAAEGTILAFLDADARAKTDWLEKAVRYFDDPAVGTVGGPNLTPPEDDVWQQVSGHIYASTVGGGPTAIRYKIAAGPKPVKELPSCNLLARRELFARIGGFDDADFLTAEDAKACYEIENLGLQNLYTPDVIVYHHRRRAYRAHLRQAFRYGYDKALLVKELPSLYALVNFAPLVFLLMVAGAVGFGLAAGSAVLLWLGVGMAATYLLLALASSFVESFRLAPCIFVGIVLTHYVYAFGFVRGLIRGRSK